MFVDLPLDQLWNYRPEVAEPEDFDAFWAALLAADPLPPADFRPVSTPITFADVFDVTFSGAGGASIRAWLTVPHRLMTNTPVVVEFVGYNGGRGDPLDWLTWPAAGYPHLVMDSRGQGGGWRTADTADPGDLGAPSTNGFLTRGIAEPKTHYYARLFVDAARAVDVARGHPSCADRRVVACGGSQGGALALAAAHLNPAVDTVLPNVPFLAHIRRAAEITAAKPYSELAEYCAVRPAEVDRVFRTLSYFDVVNHARRVDRPALFAVGLLDEITPASTVFAAYQAYAGSKEMAVYPFNGHEGGGITHLHAQLDFLSRRFPAQADR